MYCPLGIAIARPIQAASNETLPDFTITTDDETPITSDDGTTYVTTDE